MPTLTCAAGITEMSPCSWDFAASRLVYRTLCEETTGRELELPGAWDGDRVLDRGPGGPDRGALHAAQPCGRARGRLRARPRRRGGRHAPRVRAGLRAH